MTDRIRLLQLIYSFDIEGSGGGLSRFVIALSRMLDKNKFDITVGSLWDTGTAREHEHRAKLLSEGIKVFTAANWDKEHPLKSFKKSYDGLKNYLKDNPVDIIHSHSEFSDIVTLLLKFSLQRPSIIRTLHNGCQVEWRKRYFRRLLFTYFLYPLLYDKEIGVAHHLVNNLDRRWLAKWLKRRSILINNAIEFARFADTHPISNKSILKLGIPDNALVIGTVGRLREEKGYAILLEAATKIVHQSERPIIFIIIGTGEQEEFLMAKTLEFDLQEHVIFTGPRTDIEFLLSGMDIFICSSYWEGFSSAILEAMAAGVPVLATDIPGNRELVVHGQNGWIVPVGDSDALHYGLTKIINVPKEERKAIILHARKIASKYSIESVTEQHQNMYYQLYKNKRG